MTERGLTRKQIERLLKAIDHSHVEQKRGLSYISQHQARAEMNRVFGPGNWDSQVVDLQLVYEYDQMGSADDGGPGGKNMQKKYYIACYRAGVRVNIRDYWGNPVASFTEYHAESNSPLPNRGEAHAMAITSVESYALRRALIGLGDRFGLGLYNDGKEYPLVVGSLILTDEESPLYRKPETPATPNADRQSAFNTRNGDSSAGGQPLP